MALFGLQQLAMQLLRR